MLAADLLWDGLTRLGPDLRAEPALALGWSSDDARNWVFELDPGATFADGSPLTAADVVATLTGVAAEGEASLAATRLERVEGWEALARGDAEELHGLEALDDTTVRIRLSAPEASLPELLAGPLYGIVPASAAAGITLDVMDTLDTLSSGARATAGDGGVLRLELHETAGALLDAVELHPYGDADGAWEALADGDVDWAPVPPRLSAADVPAEVEVTTAPSHTMVLLGLRGDNGPLTSRALRQAIAAAIDQEDLVASVYPDRARPLADLVPVGALAHDPDVCEKYCGGDPESARELLEEAFGDAAVPEVRVDHEDSDVQVAVAARVVSQLRDAGIPARAVGHRQEDYATLIAAGQAQAFVTGWVGLHPRPDAFVTPLLASGSRDNVVGLRLETLDVLLAADRADLGGADPDRWRRIGAQVREVAVLVPIAQLETRIGHSAAVRDLDVRLDGTVDLASVWLSR
jgi:peptide/nickel transport system substrate-binding protein